MAQCRPPKCAIFLFIGYHPDSYNLFKLWVLIMMTGVIETDNFFLNLLDDIKKMAQRSNHGQTTTCILRQVYHTLIGGSWRVMIGATRLGPVLRHNSDVILLLRLPVKHGCRGYDPELGVDDELVEVEPRFFYAIGNLKVVILKIKTYSILPLFF